MTDFIEYLTHHPRALMKTAVALFTVVGLIFKVVVPMIKERVSRVKDVTSNESGEPYLQNGLELYNQGSFDEGVSLMINGLELGNCHTDSVLNSCKALIHYYHQRGEEHNSLRWARFALDKNCCDNQILLYMIDMYNKMGEIEKAEQLKELLKKS